MFVLIDSLSTLPVNPETSYSLYASGLHLASGLTTGLAGLAAGWAIGIVGDVSVRKYAFQDRIFVGMVLILIFAEVLGLYGLIVSLILDTKSQSYLCP